MPHETARMASKAGHGLKRPIIWFAHALGTVPGFYGTMGSMGLWGILGKINGFSDRWILGFTLYLSVLSIVQSASILVQQHSNEHKAEHREAASQAKLNELVRALPQADSTLAGNEVIEGED